MTQHLIMDSTQLLSLGILQIVSLCVNCKKCCHQNMHTRHTHISIVACRKLYAIKNFPNCRKTLEKLFSSRLVLWHRLTLLGVCVCVVPFPNHSGKKTYMGVTYFPCSRVTTIVIYINVMCNLQSVDNKSDTTQGLRST